uniref:Uncharacterized protein n=1 Tax=Arundo donax TaxID=35708 RepID=A0A0A9FY94_ARUDO
MAGKWYAFHLCCTVNH